MKKNITLWLILVLAALTTAQTQNELLVQFNQATSITDKISLAKKLGFAYQRECAHRKAIDYFKQTEQWEAQTQIVPSTLQSIAFSAMQLGDLELASVYYQKVLPLLPDNEEKAQTYYSLAQIAKDNKDEAKAMEYIKSALVIHQNLKDDTKAAADLNNLGYLALITQNPELSKNYFTQALELYAKINETGKLSLNTLLNNSGVIYGYMGDYRTAEAYFSQALANAESNRDSLAEADALNYYAAHDIAVNQSEKALNKLNQAVTIAEIMQNDEILATSYQLLAELYKRENNIQKYHQYTSLHQNIKDKIRTQEVRNKQRLLEIQAEVEQKESAFKQLTAETARQAMLLKQLELEKEKQQQDLLLLRNKEELQTALLKNQELEKMRIQQLLRITQQKAEADRQQQAIVVLQKEKELQELLLNKQEAEKKEKEQAIALLEKDSKLREQKLQEELRLKKYFYWIIALIGLVLLIIAIALINTYRFSRRIEKQKDEIERQKKEIEHQSNEIIQQNEELQQSQEEIMTQRDFIAKQNESLQHHNQMIESSIRAAKTIQGAMLTSPNTLQALFGQTVIFYRPRDVVSGDFYWATQIGNTKFLAVADCTGHGVPGAFMSIIGTSLIEKIVFYQKITSPADILNALNYEIQQALSQKETGDRNGMDIAFITIENADNNEFKIVFAAAKRPLMYVKPNSAILEMLQGDKLLIGGGYSEKKGTFQNQTIYLPAKTWVYLSSDGYADQCNEERRKFTTTRFNELITEISKLSPIQQYDRLANQLDTHQQAAEQRDDITVVGICLV